MAKTFQGNEFGSLIQMLQQQYNQQKTPNKWAQNSYLDSGGYNTNDPNMDWEGFVRQLNFSQLDNVTDFNSPMYQQYRGMLQKTTPGMGLNTLLGMAMSSGTGYAGGQGIANQKAMQFNKQRNDSINNGVGQFTTNMQSQAQGLLGQIGGSFAATADRKLQQEQLDAASSPWGAIGSGIGGLLGTFIAPGIGTSIGASLGGALAGGSGSGTAGYKPTAQKNYNTMGDYNYGGGGFNGGWMRG